MFALFRFALLIVFIAAAWICLAQDQVSRVVILGGNVTIEVPAGWEVVEGERKCLVGPKDAPFISMGYFRASPPTDDAVVDAAFAKHFVQNNLKVEKCEDLPGDRLIAHASDRSAADSESHQWNVVKRVDAHHLAVLLVGVTLSKGKQEIVSVVDRLARTAEFTSSK